LNLSGLPIKEVGKNSGDLAIWFDRVGCAVDIGALGREFGVRPTPLRDRAARMVQAAI
jgi:hypothetical protein